MAEGPGNDSVKSGVYVVVLFAERSVLPGKCIQELRFDKLSLLSRSPIDPFIAHVDGEPPVLLYHVINHFKQETTVNGRVQITRETVAIDTKLPVEYLRFRHITCRVVIAPVAISERGVGDIKCPQPGCIVRQSEASSVVRPGEIQFYHGLSGAVRRIERRIGRF